MPNWCANSLVLEHEDNSMIVRAENAFARGEFCQEFFPCPEDLKNTTSPNRDEALAEQLYEKYGYSDWYNFQVSEWGTKWDFGDPNGINEVNDNSIVLYFDSAWSPPIAMMEKLEELGFTVNLMYDEPGMAFCGQYIDGNDTTYEYGELSADKIDEEIPVDINETFCIAEHKRMWEEENGEEE